MDIVCKILTEDNKAVEALIDGLDRLIHRLRKSGKTPPEYRLVINELYQESVVAFIEKFTLQGVEVPPDLQEYYEDLIYNLILTLKDFED